MAKPQVDFVAKARAAWGDAPPDWVMTLAAEANRIGGARAAARIGYSPALVTHVLGNAYGGDLARVELKVRGALMGETVACPVFGDMPRDRCLDQQKKPRRATSAAQAKCWRHCNGRGAPLCPHSRIAAKKDGGER